MVQQVSEVVMADWVVGEVAGQTLDGLVLAETATIQVEIPVDM
jgi:hypothetical protein